MIKQFCFILMFILMTRVSPGQGCNAEEYLPASVSSERLAGTYYPYMYKSNDSRFFTDWTRGKVLMINGLEVKDALLRYDCVFDELTWMRESDFKTAILDKSKITGFTIENGLVRFKKHALPSSIYTSKEPFLEVLVEGDLSLYLKHRREINHTTDEIITHVDYYFLKEGQYTRFKPSRFTIMRIFKDEKDKIRSLSREYKLKFKTKDQIIRFVKLYNQNQPISAE